MAYSKQVIETVKDEFEARRQNAVNSLESRKAEMYGISLIFKQIDDALAATGLKIYKAALDGKVGLEERLAEIRKENEQLQDDKRRLLKMNGKPENYLDIIYSCKKCSDTGYVGTYMCDCFKKALAKEAYRSSGLGSVLEEQSFDNFDLSFYSDTKDKNGVSPKEYMASILARAKEYAKTFGKTDKNDSLLFIGKTGLGKTHISTAIAKEIIDKGHDVVYDTIGNIINTYEQQTFGHSEEAANTVARYLECDLLIIDDLGTEFKNAFTQSVIYNLLNTRINSGKAMIISTNLDDGELFKKQYDDRINSRLIGSFRSFRFHGEDIRIKKTIMQNKK
ncbi:MAG: ATP-binding protein [Clostridia bacterium]|nr:ATP-binding protein [Clostridia bacterium]